MIVLVVDGGTYVCELGGDEVGSDVGDGRVFEPTKDGAAEGLALLKDALVTNDLAQHRHFITSYDLRAALIEIVAQSLPTDPKNHAMTIAPSA